jgi:hypothetical protein
MNLSKRFFLFFSVLVLFCGCLTPKRIDRWVNDHYDGAIPSQSKRPSNYIFISSKLVTATEPLSKTEKKTAGFLPLIVYWRWDYQNICTINPAVPISSFSASASSYANKKGLQQKLNGATVELSIDTIPDMFILHDKEHFIIIGVSWEDLSVQPLTHDLSVSYRVMQGGNEIKHGVITVVDNDKTYDLQFLQSLKKRTNQFLDQYDTNINTMSKAVIDQLIAQL